MVAELAKEVFHGWEQFNKNEPLWVRNSVHVTNEEYASFFKLMFNDGEDHLSLKHVSVERQLEFRTLLFVLRRASLKVQAID